MSRTGLASIGFTGGMTGRSTSPSCPNAVAFAMLPLSADHWTGWAMSGAGQLLLGLALGAENADELGYPQSVTPERLRGRMHATVCSINRALVVNGAPIGGVLAPEHHLDRGGRIRTGRWHLGSVMISRRARVPYPDACLTGDTLDGWRRSVCAICATTGERSWIGWRAERP